MTRPRSYSIRQLALEPAERLDKLARSAAGGMTYSRLLLGQVLCAMQRSRAYERFGCAGGSLHYASCVLDMDYKLASESRLVATRLEGLPLLTEAAEQGAISWSALRIVTPVCTPENEAEWLQHAQSLNSRMLEKLVRGLKKAAGAKVEDEDVELKLWLQPEVFALFARTCRALSHEAGRRLPMSECLEALCADYLTGAAFPEGAAESKLRRDAQRDVLAQRERSNELLPHLEAAPTGLHDSEPPVPDQPIPHADVDGCCSEPDSTNETAVSGRRQPLPGWVFAASQDDPYAVTSEPTSAQAASSWQNPRLRFNGGARLLTEAQREEILRRDGFACSTPGCPNQLWLHVHHIEAFSRGGATLPENLVTVCSACHRALHRGAAAPSARFRTWASVDRRGRATIDGFSGAAGSRLVSCGTEERLDAAGRAAAANRTACS